MHSTKRAVRRTSRLQGKPVRDADVKKQRFFQRKSNEARLLGQLRLAKLP